MRRDLRGTGLKHGRVITCVCIYTRRLACKNAASAQRCICLGLLYMNSEGKNGRISYILYIEAGTFAAQRCLIKNLARCEASCGNCRRSEIFTMKSQGGTAMKAFRWHRQMGD